MAIVQTHPSVAVLGTGIMGAAMARNLVKAGLAVTVWNRTAARALPLAHEGAIVGESPAQAVAEADVVLTMLFDGAAVSDVMTEALPAMKPGSVWMLSTTSSLDEIAAFARLADSRGIDFVDAPVLGTRAPAEAGQLTVLAAAKPHTRATLQHICDAVGSRTVWTGEDPAAASATRLKLVANSWVVALTNATGETMSLAQALGVDPQAFFDVIDGGPLDNGYLRAKAQLILDDALEPPSFAVDTAAKDARLIFAAGCAHGAELDGIEAAIRRYDRVIARGYGGEDMAAAYRASSVDLASPHQAADEER